MRLINILFLTIVVCRKLPYTQSNYTRELFTTYKDPHTRRVRQDLAQIDIFKQSLAGNLLPRLTLLRQLSRLNNVLGIGTNLLNKAARPLVIDSITNQMPSAYKVSQFNIRSMNDALIGIHKDFSQSVSFHKHNIGNNDSSWRDKSYQVGRMLYYGSNNSWQNKHQALDVLLYTDISKINAKSYPIIAKIIGSSDLLTDNQKIGSLVDLAIMANRNGIDHNIANEIHVQLGMVLVDYQTTDFFLKKSMTDYGLALLAKAEESYTIYSNHLQPMTTSVFENKSFVTQILRGSVIQLYEILNYIIHNEKHKLRDVWFVYSELLRSYAWYDAISLTVEKNEDKSGAIPDDLLQKLALAGVPEAEAAVCIRYERDPEITGSVGYYRSLLYGAHAMKPGLFQRLARTYKLEHAGEYQNYYDMLSSYVSSTVSNGTVLSALDVYSFMRAIIDMALLESSRLIEDQHGVRAITRLLDMRLNPINILLITSLALIHIMSLIYTHLNMVVALTAVGIVWFIRNHSMDRVFKRTAPSKYNDDG